MTATAVATVTGDSAYWVGQIARRYNTDGPDCLRDRRHTTCAGRPDLTPSQLAELGAAVAGPHPLDHPLPLVASAHQETPRTETN